MNADKGKLTSELSDRLDDLFSEDDDTLEPEVNAPPRGSAEIDREPAAVSGTGTQNAPNDSPLINLDAIVLSLDWEITDENLEKLINEIERLKELYKDARLPYMFLQLHGSVGKYIASKKVDAHPDSIKLLHSVHAGLEKVLLNQDISELEKKKILSEEVKKFKGLKHQIMLTKSIDEEGGETASPKKTLATATPAQPPVPAKTITGNLDRLDRAFLDEIKQLIKEEFNDLKQEILSWKQTEK